MITFLVILSLAALAALAVSIALVAAGVAWVNRQVGGDDSLIDCANWEDCL